MGLKGNERPSFPFPKNLGRLSLGWQSLPKVMPATGWIFPLPWRLPSQPHRELRRCSWAVGMGSWGFVGWSFWHLCVLRVFICVIILPTWRFFVNTWFLLVMRRVFGSRWIILEIEGERNEKRISQDPPDVLVLAGGFCSHTRGAASALRQQRNLRTFFERPKNRVANDSNILTYFQKLGLLIYFYVRSCLPTQVGKHTRINKGVSSFNSSKNHVSPWRMAWQIHPEQIWNMWFSVSVSQAV